MLLQGEPRQPRLLPEPTHVVCEAAFVLDDQAAVMASAFGWAAQLGIKTALGTETPMPQARETIGPKGKLINSSVALASAIYDGIFRRLNAMLGSTLDYYWPWTSESYSWSKPAHNSTE